MSGVGVVSAFVAGLASFLSPCVLPLVPVYLAQLVGPSIWQTRAAHTESPATSSQALPARAQTLWHASAFVAGFSLIFLALGATASRLGALLVGHQVLLRQLGALVLIGFGVQMAGLVHLPGLERERRFQWRVGTPGYATSLIIGVIFGLGWTPCVGPLLGSVLVLAAQARTLTAGVTLLGVYALGLGIPFLLVGAAFDQAAPRLRWLTPWTGMIERVAGLLLVLLGVAIWFNWLLIASSWFSIG